jgi:hypothetical protein
VNETLQPAPVSQAHAIEFAATLELTRRFVVVLVPHHDPRREHELPGNLDLAALDQLSGRNFGIADCIEQRKTATGREIRNGTGQSSAAPLE